MRGVLLCLLFIHLVFAKNFTDVVNFANNNWMCADVSCSEKVGIGQFQPNYECAEFVSRSLAAGGFVPGLGPLDSQSDYLNYKYDGVAYDLLWVSSKQGKPLGLEDFLIKIGWKPTDDKTTVQAGYVLMLVGSDGPYSHTGIGVADGLTDAHNAAHHLAPLSVYLGVDMIYHYPNATATLQTKGGIFSH